MRRPAVCSSPAIVGTSQSVTLLIRISFLTSKTFSSLYTFGLGAGSLGWMSRSVTRQCRLQRETLKPPFRFYKGLAKVSLVEASNRLWLFCRYTSLLLTLWPCGFVPLIGT